VVAVAQSRDDGEVDRLRDALQPEPTAERPPQVKLVRIRAPGVDVGAVAEELGRWYRTQGLECTITADPQGHTVQCRTAEAWKRALGMGAALTTVLRAEQADLLLEIGAARWLGKGMAGGASLVAAQATPLAPVAWVTIGIGAWRQYKLPQQTIDFLRATAPSYQRKIESAPAPPIVASAPIAPVAPVASIAPVPPAARQVDVGSAGFEELAAVPGLDAGAARLIVDERDRRGGFGSLAEVRRVLARRVQPHEFRRLSSHLYLARPVRRQPVPGQRRVVDL